MLGLLSMLLSTVLKVGLNYLTNWYQQKQSEVDRFNLAASHAQLESVVDGHALEVKMDQAMMEVKPITTLAELKASFGVKQIGSVLACLLLMLTLSGCWTVNVTTHEYKSEIKKPEPPPAMFQGDPALSQREQAMTTYIQQLRAGMDTYNADAHESNIKNGYIKTKTPKP